MINLIYPPGCYGTYLSKCIYNYTNLRKDSFVTFEFDNSGSSHDYRFNEHAQTHIRLEHIDTFVPTSNTNIVALLPDQEHSLDYYNNQYHKQENGQLISYIKTNYSEEEIVSKLKNNWNMSDGLSEHTPLWILREWCSFWITDCWSNGYNRNRYSNVSNICVEVNDLVESFELVFIDLIDKLNLTLTVDLSIIQQTHYNFQRKQRFHNSQLRCNEWVNCVINKQPNILTDLTIFNEAYIQHLLRVNGYEIYCDGLNRFPLSSFDMKELIYKT